AVDDVPLFARARRHRGPHRDRGAPRAGEGSADGRHRAARREGGRDARNGRRLARRVATAQSMKKPAIRIRRVEPRDAEALQAIYSEPLAMSGTLQIPFPSVEMWRKRLAEWSADDYMLVAEAGGELVGNAGLHSMGRSARRRHVGYIGMAVRDDWHGKGVGTALMAAIVDLPDNWLGYRRLELTSYTHNAAASGLYRKL